MTEHSLSWHENNTGLLQADFELICPPISAQACRECYISGSWYNISYVVKKELPVTAPISGIVKRITRPVIEEGFVIEIESQSSIALLTNISELYCSQSDKIYAGQLIGKTVPDKKTSIQQVRLIVASKIPYVSLLKFVKSG